MWNDDAGSRAASGTPVGGTEGSRKSSLARYSALMPGAKQYVSKPCQAEAQIKQCTLEDVVVLASLLVERNLAQFVATRVGSDGK